MPIDYVNMLKEFHQKFGHHIQTIPTATTVPVNVFVLRRKLMEEELKETIDAMEQQDIVQIADGLADLLYVVFGTAMTYGIPIDAVFAEVHRSNMTKSMLKDSKSIKGKTIKGPDFSPADIQTVLDTERL